MTSTRVPGTLVRSQLSWIPGEERKFKRRRIVAVIPGSKRERDAAVSQALRRAIVPSPVTGVDSITGVSVGAGTGVSVSEFAFVAVGEGRGVAVIVSGLVAVGDDGASVASGSELWVGEGGGVRVDFSAAAVEVARAATGFAALVTGGVSDAASGEEAAVDSTVSGNAAGCQSSMNRRINRMTATVSLKTS
jgi:hypothetical protein